MYIYVYIHRYAYIILDNQFRSLDSTSAIFLNRYYNVTVLYSLKYKWNMGDNRVIKGYFTFVQEWYYFVIKGMHL